MTELNLDHFPNSGDEGDLASVSTENDLKIAMYRHKIDSHNSEIPFTGFCSFCGTPVDEGKFCPPDHELDYSCAREYQREQDAKKRNGG